MKHPTERRTHDVSGRRHGIQMALLEVDSESDNSTNKRTELEDGPEDTECLALILLEWVTHHDTPLGRPKQGGGDTEDRASENQEPTCTLGLMTSGRGG